MVFTTKSAKKTILAHEFWVITSILRVWGLKLHSSGTKPVTFFGAQSSFGGRNSRLGAQAVIWGALPWNAFLGPGVAASLQQFIKL